MQNPGLQIEIPEVNDAALLEEPMNNNGMSQATIVNNNRRNNNSNNENGLSVYSMENENIEMGDMNGGRKLKRRHTKKRSHRMMKRTHKAKKTKKSRHGSRK